MKILSVVLVTHNEEDILEECLKSVSFADEIIVVDAESTDRTLDIAKKFTDKIIKTTNKPNPNVNMNIGFEAANGDWILLIAPDERVTEELQKEILSTINSPDAKDGYYIPRKNYFLGKWLKHGGHYPDWQLRLFRKGQGKFSCKDIHEHLTVKGTTGYLKGNLIHLTVRSLSQQIRRMDFYTETEAITLKKQGVNWSFFVGVKLLIIKPILYFIWSYFFKLGFLDGVVGFIYAIDGVWYLFTIGSRLWELEQNLRARKNFSS